MKKLVLLTILTLGLSLPGRAQEKLISDTIVFPPVFSGYIGYRISYSGKLSHEQKHWLPDSMVVLVKEPVVRIRFFGGMAPQLLHDIYWNREDDNFLLVDHHNQAAYVPDMEKPQAAAKLLRPDGKETIVGLPCLTYNIETAGENLRVWAGDSTYFPLTLKKDSLPRVRPVFFQAELPLIPLKTVRSRAGITTTTIATQVVRTDLPDHDFHLPSGYTRVAFEGQMSRHPFIGGK